MLALIKSAAFGLSMCVFSSLLANAVHAQQQCPSCETISAGGNVKLSVKKGAQQTIKIGVARGHDIMGVFNPSGKMVDFYLKAPNGPLTFGSNLVIANKCFSKDFTILRQTVRVKICVSIELV